ncbi:FtsL-like putative cell division protein [Croceiramulus getboli]|nr:FtsL-like putative cell division protein [Flavobacteriaceae bacterium YJPT1-3]
MKKGLYDILKGQFLINEDAVKNWRMIIFLSLLAVIMIASSHSADKKVHRIAALNAEVRQLRSASVDARLELRKLVMESTVARAVASRGVQPANEPPKKIKVNKSSR